MQEHDSGMKRALLSRSAFIFIIRFFPLAATTAAGIAFSHLVSPTLNGIYSRLWIVYTGVFAAIGCFGLAPLLMTHSAASVDEWLRNIRRRQLTLFVCWQLLLAGILVLFFLKQDAFAAWVAAPLMLVQVWVLLGESYLIIHERFGIALAASIGYSICFALAHVGFLMGRYNLTTLFLIIALTGVLRGLILSIAARQQYQQARQQLCEGVPMPVAIRKQWMQLGIYDISQMLYRWIDKLALSAIIAPALFAVYLNGTLEVPFVGAMLGAVGSGLLQQMARGEKTTAARIEMLQFAGSGLARIIFPLFFFLFFFREEFVVFVFSEKYQASAPLFAISICTLLLRTYDYTALLQHLNQVKLINYGALLDLALSLLMAVPLYLLMGLKGVVLAFTISSFLQAFFYLAHAARLTGQGMHRLIPWRQWLWMLVVFGTFFWSLHRLLTSHFAQHESLFLGAAAAAVLILAALGMFLFRKKSYG